MGSREQDDNEVKDLIHHISKWRVAAVEASDPAPDVQYFAVWLPEDKCSCNEGSSHDASGDTSTVGACWLLSLKTAFEVFKLEKRLREPNQLQEAGSDAYKWLRGFLREMLAPQMRTNCVSLDDWKELPESPWGEDWEKLFTDASLEVLPAVPFEPTFEEILAIASASLNWEMQHSIPMGATLLRFGKETILYIRLRYNQTHWTHLLFDMHSRETEWEIRSVSSCFVYPSVGAVASFVTALVKHSSEGKSNADGSANPLRWTALNIRPSDSVPSNIVSADDNSGLQNGHIPSPSPDDPTLPKDPKWVEPPAHSTPPKSQPTMEDSKKGNHIRNRVSKQRLHSEFGWQMALQNQRLNLPYTIVEDDPSKRKTAQEEPKGKTVQEKPLPSKEPKNSPSPPANGAANGVKPTETKSKTPNSVAPRSSNILKKDIGWQLALQNLASGSEVLTPLQPPDSSANGLLGAKKADDNNTSNVSVQTLTRANVQLQKPVRDEFSWQLGLIAKSLTFPLNKPTQDDHLVQSEFGVLSSTTLQEGPSQQPTTYDGSSPGCGPSTPIEATATNHSPREVRRGEETFTCEHCFGVVPVEGNRFHFLGCTHSFCKDCVRRHLLVKMEESTYPLLCPACGLYGVVDLGRADLDLLRDVDLGHEEERYLRLERDSRGSVTYSCLKCHSAGVMSPENYRSSTRLHCPRGLLCQYQWCKTCHKETKRSTPHRCVTSKRERLFDPKGWRFCPGMLLNLLNPLSNLHLSS
ncbi:hypothetical protein CC2G_011744 [Coprinopsis cinerea AmutBmut pab1-1]|nr:hypothetical protein CC2G_011744 [Coprinopsis cinerea AmutBmut pab1-1]